MNIICYLVIEVLFTWCQVMWCDWFLILKRRNNGISWYIRFSVLSVLSYLSQQVKPQELAPIWATVHLIVLLVVLYEGSIKQTLAYMAWLVTLGLLMAVLSMTMMDAIKMVLPVSVNQTLIDMSSRVIETFFTACSCYFLYRHNKKGIRLVPVMYLILFAIITFVNVAVLVILDIHMINIEQEALKLLLQLAFIIMIIVLYIENLLLMLFIESKNEHREKERMAQNYLDAQKQYYELLRDKDLQTRKFRHDIRSHLATMQILCQKGNYEGIKEYLDNINGIVDNMANSFSVGHEIIDAMLNQYAYQAEKESIEMQVSGRIPNNLNISTFDLCTIFSNLLQNAIEAASKCKSGKIYVLCQHYKGNLLLTIQNDFEKKPESVGGRFKTSKLDEQNHGFGMMNVKECVERNGGTFYTEIVDKYFKAVVLLDCCYNLAES